MAFNLNATLVLQDMDTAAVRRSIKKLDSHFESGTSKAKTFSDAIALRGINLAGYTAVTLVIAKLSESVSRATQDAIRFEYELAKIAQTVDQSNADIKAHSASIRKMSVDYGLSAPKIAETIRVLSQAGYTFNQAKAAADSLAQSTLLSSFESLSDTTDGLIAINKQFVSTMGDSARVIALLNNVSKKYAVESSDLVEATRKAGGIFSATGGTLEELATVFTTVRDTTRESAETISTALRTIFSRLQRPKTIEYMREFGIELTDLKGNFIGNYNAIKAIQQGIADNNISSKSTAFAGIVEAIGGIRQQSTTIPLLLQGAKMQRVWNDTQKSGVETAKDLAKAQDTLSFKLSQLQQNFSKFVNDLVETESFKLIANAIIALSNATLQFASSLRELLPLLGALFSIKVLSSASRLFSKGFAGNAILGTRVKGFNRGGVVPGEGTGDKVKALLEPGEFVVTADAAKRVGYGNLHEINKMHFGGVVRRYAKGGKVHKFASGGEVPNVDNLEAEAAKVISEFTKALAGSTKPTQDAMDGFVSSLDDVGRQLKKALTKLHPDRNPNDPNAQSNFLRATVLRDRVQSARNFAADPSTEHSNAFGKSERSAARRARDASRPDPAKQAAEQKAAAEAQAKADQERASRAKAQADLDAKNAAAAQAAARATANAQKTAAAAGGGAGGGPPRPPRGPVGPVFGPPSNGFQGPGFINKPALDGRSKADTSAKLSGGFVTAISLMTGVAASLVDTYGDQNSAMTRMTSTLLTLVSTIAAAEALLALFNLQLSVNQLATFGKNLVSGSKGLANIATAFQGLIGAKALRVGAFGASLAASGAARGGVVGGATKLAGKALSGGATVALGPTTAKIVSLGAAAAAAGVVVFGFSKLVDAGLGLEQKKNKAIDEGNVAEAGRLAASQQAQDDLTKLAAVAAATVTFIPGIGPVLGALIGFGIKLTGLIPGVESLVGGARDLAASFGILESNALIVARAEAGAANKAIEQNRTKQQAQVTKQQANLNTKEDLDRYLQSSTFKASTSKVQQGKRATNTLLAENEAALTQQSQTGVVGGLADRLGSGFGLWGETIADTSERLSKEAEQAREDLKAQASADFEQHSKAFTLSIDNFVAEGGTDWNKYLDSIDAGAKDLLLLSGHAAEMQEALQQNVKVMREEAAERLFNYQLLQRTAPALLALENASKKAAAITTLGDNTANLTSGNFQANSLTSAAGSDNIKTQASVAKILGIKDYESIVGGSTVAKDQLKKANEAFNSAGPDNTQAQKEFQDTLKEIILAGDPNVDEGTVDKLKLPELEEAANKIANAGDEVREKLLDAAAKTDQGANQLKAAFDKRIEAEAALNQSIFDTAQARNSRAKDLEGFRGSGTLRSDILSRRTSTDESGRAEAARNTLADAASGTAITKAKIADLQATQAAGGNIDVEELKTLQSSLLVFDTAMKSATATLNLDTQQRLANIESLKESLAVEKSRTDSFKASGKKLLYGSEEEKFKEKIALRRGAKIESQLTSGNGADAIRSTQQAAALGIDVGGITSKFSAANQEKFSRAEDAAIARATRGGAYGEEFQSIQKSDTTREGERIFGDIAKQERGLQGNEDAMNVAKAEEAKSAIMAADRFGGFVSQMDGSLKTFSTELSNIVNSLQNSSVTMKLDTTRLDVNLGDPAMFSALQDGLKKELMSEISKKFNDLAMGIVGQQ